MTKNVIKASVFGTSKGLTAALVVYIRNQKNIVLTKMIFFPKQQYTHPHLDLRPEAAFIHCLVVSVSFEVLKLHKNDGTHKSPQLKTKFLLQFDFSVGIVSKT